MGGSITLTSHEGQGSTFAFKIVLNNIHYEENEQSDEEIEVGNSPALHNSQVVKIQ
jgi:hypothetical protein